MYYIYQTAIKKYIIEQLGGEQIVEKDGILKLEFIVLRFDDIEWRSKKNVILCMKWMFKFFGVSFQEIQFSPFELYIDNQIKIKRFYHGQLGEYMYRLNNYSICVMENNGNHVRALLLFLVDPLGFIERDFERIRSWDDCVVRDFLLGLGDKCKNIMIMHIKYWLVMELDLIDDIKQVIVESYIENSFNKEIIIMGSP